MAKSTSNNLGMFLNALPLELIRKFALQMDEGGFHGAWFPEITFNDGLTPIAFVGTDTKHLKLGSAVVGAWSRSPLTMALTMATLNSGLPGRVILGVGSQARPYVNNWHGREYSKPLTAMREYVEIVKKILAGETVTYAGEVFSIKQFALTFPPQQPVPVYMAAVGPKMLELAGEIADGVIGAFWSVEYVKNVVMPRLEIGAKRAGRSLDNFEVSLGMPTLCTNDAEAFKLHRGQVMQYSTATKSSPAYELSVSAAGFADELESLKANVANKDYGAALDGISDDMVDRLTITGDVANVKRRVAEYHAAGVTLLQANTTPPGAYFPFYEGHLDGAPFPEFDFPGFLEAIETFITSMSS
jgi:alkanesulfonate monooxygenase SsuD/methylene tetrahydromethanopterin reductase-like flavin-dependent oxidoreductase (luciferase family)